MASYRKDYSVLFHDAAQDECERVAELIVEEIKASPATPRDTGRMAEGYSVRKTESGAEVYNTVDYWRPVEYGHRIVRDDKTVGYVKEQPHVRPSIEVVKKELS